VGDEQGGPERVRRQNRWRLIRRQQTEVVHGDCTRGRPVCGVSGRANVGHGRQGATVAVERHPESDQRE